MPPDDSRDDWVRIEELAEQSQMTVRNIRAHRSRGLLPPPRMVGRVGYYGPLHRRRLAQIRQMQDEGLNLAAISRVLIDGRLTDVTAGVFREPEGQPVDGAELAERFGIEAGASVLAAAVDAGVLSSDGDELRIASPRLLAVADRLASLGVPFEAQLDAVGALREEASRVAQLFMDLADEHLIARVAIETRGDLDAIGEVTSELHDLAREALQSVFDQAMSRVIADYFEGLTDPA